MGGYYVILGTDRKGAGATTHIHSRYCREALLCEKFYRRLHGGDRKGGRVEQGDPVPVFRKQGPPPVRDNPPQDEGTDCTL